MRKRFLCACVLACLIGSICNAQIDPHTSQYYVSPLFLNPGFTGLTGNDVKVSGISRSQWGNITNPFFTNGLNAEFTTGKNVNIGLTLFNQSAGEGGYNYLNSYLSVAYNGLRFGYSGDNIVSFGMQIGLINRKFDPQKFTLGDQWNPITGFSPLNPTNEFFNLKSKLIADIGIGAVYFNQNQEINFNPYLGVALFHINKPEDPISSSIEGGSIPSRVAITGGVNINLSEVHSLVPHFLYMKQGTATEKVVGAILKIKSDEELALLLGANYRFNDALIPFIGINYKKMNIGISYDVNASSLGKLTNNPNSIEITLSYLSGKSERLNTSYIKCPAF